MSVARDAGRWRMLYTALATAEEGAVQRTALATADDLIRWEKSPANPVATADPRWCAVVAAREKGGPLLRRGCVGLVVSDDFERWEAQPPLFAPRRFWDLECPQAFTVGDRWYLTAAVMEDRRQRYWHAPAFFGPWTEPADGGLLAPAGHYAGRVCRWRGADLLWCWHQPRLVEGWLTSARTVDWLVPRNPFGKWLAPPLELVPRADGSLARRSFAGWDAYRERPPAPVHPALWLYGGENIGGSAPWRVVGNGRMEVLVAATPAGDGVIEGEIGLAGSAGGVAFRLDGDGGGYFVEVRPGSATVRLQKWLPTAGEGERQRGYAWRDVQGEELPTPVPVGEPVSFGLLVCGPYIELSLGGEVVLATFSGERLAGRWGIWTAGGAAIAPEVRFAPLRRPWAARGRLG